MSALAASEAYALWAPSYSDETAISAIEDKLVAAMTPQLAGRRLLDAGCGTGRRLAGTDAATAVGLEPCEPMLRAGLAANPALSAAEFVIGDVRAMPFDPRSFDVIWCRLVLGHLPELGQAYRELARVADLGATVIVSDFHPAAADAGHRRNFRNGDRVIEIEHHVHRPPAHIAAAAAAGLTLSDEREAAIGNDVLPFYRRAGRLDAFHDHIGLPVVLALAFRKER